jgi:hypothetical protein
VRSPLRFGAWHAIEAALAAAPSRPGVLQVRADAVLSLPRGKSAMVFYAATDPAEPLAEWLSGAGQKSLEATVRLGGRYVRFAESADPQRDLARLLAQFEERFGAVPCGNRPET